MACFSAVAPHEVIDEMRQWLVRRSADFAESHVLDLPFSQEVWFQITQPRTAMIFMTIFGKYLVSQGPVPIL